MTGLIETVLVFILALFIHKTLYSQHGHQRKSNRKKVPEVSGYLPIIGHLRQMVRDPHAFIESCYVKYGKIFMIRLGRKKVVFLCDRELLPEFWHADESKLSFYKFMADVNINSSFSQTIPNPVAVAIPFIKKAFIGRMGELVEEISDQMQKAMKKLTEKIPVDGSIEVDVTEMLNETFHPAVFQAAFATELTTELRSAYEDFTLAFRNSAFSSYVLPKFLINFLLMPKVREARERYISILMPIVQKYFDDENERASPIIRYAVDYKHEMLGGGKLTQAEVCQTILNLHFATVSAPITHCVHILKELLRREDLWDYVRENLNPGKVSAQEIIKNKILNAVVMEAARLNSNIGLLSRATFPHSTIGDYLVGNADVVSAAGALLFERSTAEDIFKNASKFNPERFLKDDGSAEPSDSKSIWLWGAGTHSCPGRNVSINEAKIFITHFVTNFNVRVTHVGPRDYMTFNAIPLQTLKLEITKSKHK